MHVEAIEKKCILMHIISYQVCLLFVLSKWLQQKVFFVSY